MTDESYPTIPDRLREPDTVREVCPMCKGDGYLEHDVTPEHPLKTFYVEHAVSIPDDPTSKRHNRVIFTAWIGEALDSHAAEREARLDARRRHPTATDVEFFLTRTGVNMSAKRVEQIRAAILDGTWQCG